MAKPKNARLIAASILNEVHQQGRSLSAACDQHIPMLNEPRDRSFCRQLVYGVCRWHNQLDALLSQLTRKKIKDTDIYWVILLGLYQLQHTRVPSYAAISESVQASRKLKKNWASGLINGILRSFQREQETLMQGIEDNPVARYSHPYWLIRNIQSAWPDDWQTILKKNNQQGPMTLRVNTRKISRQAYLEQLTKANIQAQPHEFSAAAITLETPLDVSALPDFQQGHASVQDAAAQHAATLLQVKPGHRVLDACAAPGGKTGHILEHYPKVGSVTALDIDASRLTRVTENLDRLSLTAQLQTGDAATPEAWWDGKTFDRILLDAPCSATGVIRRHPDIKQLRTESDIESLSRQQQVLLAALWPLLKPGGLMLYATCSILPQENEQTIAAFLESTEDASEQKIEANWGRTGLHGRQILPGEAGMDGFYYSTLQKSS